MWLGLLIQTARAVVRVAAVRRRMVPGWLTRFAPDPLALFAYGLRPAEGVMLFTIERDGRCVTYFGRESVGPGPPGRIRQPI